MMIKSLFLIASTATLATAFAPSSQQQSRTSSSLADSLTDLKELAVASNPVVGYFDPLNLATADFGEQGNDFTIGYLRHAEIKHGRVAMAAFVGYCIQSNIHWPVPMTVAGESFPATTLSPEAQWDALPENGKWQIIMTVALLEIIDEVGGWQDSTSMHYTKGRVPGKHPAFQRDTRRSNEDLAQGRLRELNNGRLAMIGIMGFVYADTVPTSVPFLTSIAQPYAGNVWAPFEANFHLGY